MLIGPVLCAGARLLTVLAAALATQFAAHPLPALLVLLPSRLVLGAAESCIGTGCIAWAIGLVGPRRTAQVISFNGIASYGGIALGAPLGLAMAGSHLVRGLESIGALAVALASFGLLLARNRPAVSAASGGASVRFWPILG